MRFVLVVLVAFSVLASAGGDARGSGSGFPGRNGLIAYEQDGDIYVADPMSRVERLLRRSRDIDDRAAYPTWSPNGRTLLFAHGARGDDIVLKTVDADGRNERTRRAAPYLYGPFSWSPDGRLVAGAGVAVDYGDQYEVIYVGERQVTRSPPRPYRQSDTAPAWSPDGALLCFQRTLNDDAFLFLKPPDGRAARKLTPGAAPDWAPDARRIVFAHRGDLYVIGRDGTHRRRLTRTPRAEAAPAWSPDGKAIAFRRGGALWVIDSDGSRERLIVSGIGNRAEPDWQSVPR